MEASMMPPGEHKLREEINARPSMISVGVGDNGMRYRSPWIDIEITDRTEETVGCDFKKIGHGE